MARTCIHTETMPLHRGEEGVHILWQGLHIVARCSHALTKNPNQDSRTSAKRPALPITCMSLVADSPISNLKFSHQVLSHSSTPPPLLLTCLFLVIAKPSTAAASPHNPSW